MDENDARVILLCLGKRSRGFGEICNIEGHQDSLLTGRFPKQLCIFEYLKRRVARCRNCVVSELPKRGRHGRWDISIQQDAYGHLGADFIHPWQLPFQLLRGLVIRCKESVNFLGIGFGIGLCDLNCHRRQPRKMLTKLCHGLILS